MIPSDLQIPDDLTDSVEIVYADDEDIDNLENDDEQDIEPIEDKSKVTVAHERSVFCVNLNSDCSLLVTGSQDDSAQVWKVEDGSPVLECTGHKDSVTAAQFSFDNKYVATADMTGLFQVWDVQSKLLVWCFEASDMEWMFWHRAGHVLFAGVYTGEIYMWQIPQGHCKVLPTPGTKCTCAQLLQNGAQLVAAYEDRSVRLWNLKAATVVHQYLNEAESQASINSLVLSSDDRLTILCGLEVGALILKTADFKLVATFYMDTEELESAAIYEEDGLAIIATGCLKGDLCFWDLHRQSLRHKTNIGCCVTHLLWGSNAMLFAAGTDGAVYLYNGKNGELLTAITGHHSSILDMKLSKDGSILATASDDCTAKIFEVNKCCSVTPC